MWLILHFQELDTFLTVLMRMLEMLRTLAVYFPHLMYSEAWWAVFAVVYYKQCYEVLEGHG